MTESRDTIVVFTARSLERILREGGSQAWVLNPVNARQCRWLVCTQNRHNPDHEFSDATEPHGAAFLIGKISGVVRAPDEGAGDRWMVTISQYARISVPGVWNHRRNPVRYASLDELGINLNEIQFIPMPEAADYPPSLASRPGGPAALLTIAEAKKELATAFGVKPEAVEITIRG
jgi:hypothetical protein